MSVRKVKYCFPQAWAATLMLLSGCTPATEDSSSLDCAALSKTFFSKPTTTQINEFGGLNVDSQYAVFICGNQVREPPSIHLATPFAKEGEAVVGFLKAKLAAARGDLTIRDILLVFAEMSRRGTYNVAGDDDLMRVITEAVGKVKDMDWRRTCEQSVREIRHEAGASAQPHSQ